MSKQKYYEENGYVIFESLIDVKKIDLFNQQIFQSFADKDIIYSQMDTQSDGPAQFTDEGFLINPIGDVHLCEYYDQNLATPNATVIDILSSKEIKSALDQLTGTAKHTVVMSMYFDKNAGTPAHQDWYYLDAERRGGITAAWIALEDIEESAGRFFVIPGTQKTFFELSKEQIKSSDAYENIIKNYVAENKGKIVAPALRKGDVLFWNSGTIHGSLRSNTNKFSRKSITAHYLPKDDIYVQNAYLKTHREIEGFDNNGIGFRLTNSVKEAFEDKGLKPRSLSSFDR